MSPLVGADRYRREEQHEVKPWDDPLVVSANEAVSIVAVLNDYFNLPVPENAQGWKVRCPLAWEHKDGGVDRQFRVYSESNTAHCFAIHNLFTPVRLWRIRTGAPTLKDAARDLLRAYRISFREPTYQERFADVRQQSAEREQISPDSLVEALQMSMAGIPEYASRQFDAEVLRAVNSSLEEVHELCRKNPTVEEARTWLRTTRAQLRAVICQ